MLENSFVDCNILHDSSLPYTLTNSRTLNTANRSTQRQYTRHLIRTKDSRTRGYTREEGIQNS